MTKKANGQGSFRKVKDNLWEGRVCVGRGPNGKVRRQSVYGKTKREVMEKAASIVAEMSNGTYIQPDEMTVKEWLEIWLKEYNFDVKGSTKNQYDYQVRVHIAPRLGNIKLQKLTPPMVQNMYNKLMKPYEGIGRKGKKVTRPGLSAKSIKNLHGVFHKALQQAVLCAYIKNNPCDACKLPKIEKKEMQTIEGDDVSAFIEEIRNDQYNYLYYVDLFTGMRQGEIIGLTWDCVDFEKGIIRVEKQLRKDHSGGSKYVFTSLKNGKTRTITPAPSVFKVLQQVQVQQKKWKMKAGESFNNKDNLVFTNEIGEHLSSVTVYNHLKEILKRIGLEGVRFHDLRHTFATISLENGDDIKTVSENLGHATVAFTLDIYGHVTEKMKRDSAERMEKYIANL